MSNEKSLYQSGESRSKVIFEFDYYEDRQEVENIINCGQAYSNLDEIFNLVRSELKHGTEKLSPHTENLLERIKELAYLDR